MKILNYTWYITSNNDTKPIYSKKNRAHLMIPFKLIIGIIWFAKYIHTKSESKKKH